MTAASAICAFPPETVQRYTASGAWGDSTLHDVLGQRAASAPDTLALVDAPNKAAWVDTPVLRLTWRETLDRADRLAFALARAGLGRGDVVLTQLPNIAEFALLHLACARLGIVVSPLHVQQRENEVLRCAAIAQPRALITMRRVGKSDQPAFERSLHGQFGLPLPVYWLEDLWTAGLAAPAPQVQCELAEQAAQRPVGGNDIHSICWTSGTEGEPKGVPRTHNNWLGVARRIADGASLRAGDVLLNPFPLVAVAGLSVLTPWLLLGQKLVLHQPTDLDVLLAQLQGEGVHYVCLAPALLNRLLTEPGRIAPGDFASLRVIGSGSGPLDAWTIREFRDRHGIEIVNFYGSNEGIGLVANAQRVPDPAQRAELFPAAGREDGAWDADLAGQARTRLLDAATGREIDLPDTPGELVVQGPTVFPGYHRAPERTAQAFTADGYFRTGDMFCLTFDDAGRSFYRFLGRYKDIVIRGGMKISPEEIDAMLVGHPKLREAACCGYPDAIMGEKLGVVAVPLAGQHVELKDITDHLRTRGLAVYKLPEALVLAERLPRSAGNKVLRRELRPLFDGSASSLPTTPTSS